MTTQATAPAFVTWTYADTAFIAFPNGNGGQHIIDEHGRNYGAWMTVERFRKLQQAKDDMASPVSDRLVKLSGHIG